MNLVRDGAWKVLHLFAGIGGGSLGFQSAGFETVGAFDYEAEICRNYDYLTGGKATQADLATITPDQLRAACTGRPNVIFTSPPCKGNSSCLPEGEAESEKYQEMNGLALRGIWLALEAWRENPPDVFLLENVPRITTRSREWLDHVIKMLQFYGYAVDERTHHCGEIGAIPQNRRRYLLIARRMETVPEFIYLPPKRRVPGIGSVLGTLPVPVPGSKAGGPMHRLQKLIPKNWVRLALIPAGGDHRDLPAEVALVCTPRNGVMGVSGWDRPANTIIGEARVDNGPYAVQDPRLTCECREGSKGITGWDSPSTTVIGQASIHNGPWQVADPRVTHPSRRGNVSVVGWAEPSHTIIGDARSYKGANVADPRVPMVVGPVFDWESRKAVYMVIMAEDGTWHRPMTTLELALIQGFPAMVNGVWLNLFGSNKKQREYVGNAVPPPAAHAIAQSVAASLNAAASGGLFLCGEPVWVSPTISEMAA